MTKDKEQMTREEILKEKKEIFYLLSIGDISFGDAETRLGALMLLLEEAAVDEALKMAAENASCVNVSADNNIEHWMIDTNSILSLRSEILSNLK